MTAETTSAGQWPLQAALAGLPISVGVMDASLVVRWVNSHAARTWGFDTPEEMLGKRLFDLLPDRRKLAPLYERVLAGEAIDRVDHVMPTSRGPRLFDVYYRALRSASGDEDQAPVGLVVMALDITDRTASLRATQRQLTEILEDTPDLVGIADTEGQVTWINRSARQLLSLPAGAAVGQLKVSDFHPDKGKTVFEQAIPVAATTGPWHGKLSWSGPGRGTINTRSIVQAHRDDSDEIVSYSVVASDITESEQYETIYRHAPMGIAIISAAGNFAEANPYLHEWLGFEPGSLVGESIAHLTPPEDMQASRDAFQAMVAGDREDLVLEKQLVRNDGTRVWAMIRARGVRNESGGFEYAVAMYQNLDERKQAEALYGETERFLNSIVENLPDMVFVKRAKDLRFVRFNKAGQDLLGTTSEQMIGKNDYDFFSKEEADFFIGKDREVLDSGMLHDIPEEPIPTPIGERWLHTRKIPILDARGEPEYLLGISTDITDERASRLELKRSHEELQRFAYAASHDLKEPLRMIRSFGEILAEDHGHLLPKEGLGYLERMRSAAERMQILIEDLLSYSKVSTQERRVSEIDLNEILAEVSDYMAPRMADHGGQLDIGKLPAVAADRSQMVQLFQNLVSNGLKFRKPDTAPIVTVSGRKRGRKVTITISDNGIGFDDKYLDRIFEVFQRLHGRTSEYKGTGIGLAICRRIVEGNNGTIAAEGRPGVGAVFQVTLPAA
ncbi:MAG: PAS domain S-box-containing protein [Myxococcota bacterium]